MDMATVERTAAIATWTILLNDSVSLLENPGVQHRVLLRTANALYRAEVINRDDLSDLLELADGALAYAVEALIDSSPEESQWPI
ncbi:hypothetical protein IV02_17605 [Pseudomonas syringae]|uniref:Uncharacterized protein n=2 Tax=Pseudomonas syringae TaxID=317 RepID=A0A085V484_PSESX|nr:hypothetical protein IV02_17605 [Pseudomonas syringae]